MTLLPAEMNSAFYETVTLGLILAVDFFVALYVLYKNPKQPVNLAFFSFVFGATVWGAGVLLLVTTKLFLFDRLIFFSGTFMIFGLVFLAKVFPNAGQVGRKFWWKMLPFLFLFAAIPFGAFIKGMTIGPNGEVWPVNGPAFPVYIITVGSYILWSIFLLRRKYFQTSGLARLQMRYLAFGAGIFAVALFICNVFLPGLGVYTFILLGPASSVVLVSLTAYAIVRHQLLDIQFFIKRGLVYAFLIGAMTVFYLGVVLVVGYAFQNKPGITILMSASLTAVFAILSVVITEKFFRLEERVKERTAQLERTREEQEQMMVDISHGLQTPLTIIRSELYLLKKNTPVADGKLGLLSKSVDDVSKFVYDLLRLARLDASQNTLKQSPVNLSELLTDMVEYFDTLSDARGITIVRQIEPGLIISGEKDKLEELVTNLVSNAFKYIGDVSEKKIIIRLYRHDGAAVLSIRDTGQGITPEDLPNIFHRFYRSKDKQQRGIEGTGLGLAICKKIAEKHGATIAVESEPGKGAMFTVKFLQMM